MYAYPLVYSSICESKGEMMAWRYNYTIYEASTYRPEHSFIFVPGLLRKTECESFCDLKI